MPIGVSTCKKTYIRRHGAGAGIDIDIDIYTDTLPAINADVRSKYADVRLKMC